MWNTNAAQVSQHLGWVCLFLVMSAFFSNIDSFWETKRTLRNLTLNNVSKFLYFIANYSMDFSCKNRREMRSRREWRLLDIIKYLNRNFQTIFHRLTIYKSSKCSKCWAFILWANVNGSIASTIAGR